MKTPEEIAKEEKERLDKLEVNFSDMNPFYEK